MTKPPTIAAPREATGGLSLLEGELRTIEARLSRLELEIQNLSAVVRGNGSDGVVHEVLRVGERVSYLQGQWKWILATLAGLVIAALGQIILRR